MARPREEPSRHALGSPAAADVLRPGAVDRPEDPIAEQTSSGKPRGEAGEGERRTRTKERRTSGRPEPGLPRVVPRELPVKVQKHSSQPFAPQPAESELRLGDELESTGHELLVQQPKVRVGAMASREACDARRSAGSAAHRQAIPEPARHRGRGYPWLPGT